MKIYLYSITNLINGKVYYGKTKKPVDKRFASHCRSAGKGNKAALKRAIRKYGAQNFIVQNLGYCLSNEAASQEEKRLISVAKKANKKLYNMTDGGDGLTGYRCTAAHKEKLRQAMLGRQMTWSDKIHATHRLTPQRYAAWKHSVSVGMKKMSTANKRLRMKKIWATRRKKHNL